MEEEEEWSTSAVHRVARGAKNQSSSTSLRQSGRQTPFRLSTQKRDLGSAKARPPSEEDRDRRGAEQAAGETHIEASDGARDEMFGVVSADSDDESLLDILRTSQPSPQPNIWKEKAPEAVSWHQRNSCLCSRHCSYSFELHAEEDALA